MKSTLRTAGRIAGLAITVALAFGAFVFAADEPYSHARIVRLSYVEGTVTVQRAGSGDWSNAPANTPIQEGFSLATGADSFAEVEFENGSTARLGERSHLEFTQLAMTESGDTVNRLALVQGYATFHVSPAHADVYEVKAGDLTLQPQGKTEFRADVDTGRMRVEIFRGEVEYSGGSAGSGALTRNKVLEIGPDSQEATLSHGIKKDDWDEWVNERNQQVAATNHAPSSYSHAPAYGWSDLNQYGTWSFYPGYGYGWAPQTASLGLWSPYTFGQWSYYPGFGYTWIGFEPWGWLPYHYGNWLFDPFSGWFWVPGGFNSWSPALVTWYQGPGVIGWTPRTVNGVPRGCAVGQAKCIVAVTADAFQNGKAVNARNLVTLEPAAATKVATPGLEPTRLAMLPGTPVTPSPFTPSALTQGTRITRRSDSGATARMAPQAPVASASPALASRPSTWHTRPAPTASSPASVSRSQGAAGGRSGGFGTWGGGSGGGASRGGDSGGMSSHASGSTGGMSGASGAGGGSHASGSGSHR